MNPTLKAFLARGIDIDQANKLIGAGENANSLSLKTDPELIDLGLSPAVIAAIRGHQRPPIPVNIVTRLLFKNRYKCCVCRDPKSPIVIHHINPWETSHNHQIENLAVICLNHHAEAHSKHDMSKNLDQETLFQMKQQWEEKVGTLDANNISETEKIGGHGDYINHQRLFELADQFEIPLSFLPYFDQVKSKGFVDKFGILNGP